MENKMSIPSKRLTMKDGIAMVQEKGFSRSATPGECFDEIERLRAALQRIRQETLLLSDSTALMCGQVARNALDGFHTLTADGSVFETPLEEPK